MSDKIAIIESLIRRVNTLIIGGAMANTFIAATGGRLGNSLIEPDKQPLARDLLSRAKSSNVALLLPTDFVVAESPESTESQLAPAGEVPDGWMALDIGPESRIRFKNAVSHAGTVFWNGPMGMFEKEPFAEGTYAVAKGIAGSAAYSVVGGGDSVAAVNKSGLEKGFNHVSTGGGASLMLLEGRTLPGVAAIMS